MTEVVKIRLSLVIRFALSKPSLRGAIDDAAGRVLSLRFEKNATKSIFER